MYLLYSWIQNASCASGIVCPVLEGCKVGPLFVRQNSITDRRVLTLPSWDRLESAMRSLSHHQTSMLHLLDDYWVQSLFKLQDSTGDCQQSSSLTVPYS